MLLEVSCPFVGYDKRRESLEAKVDFFVQTQPPPLQGVFYEGQLWRSVINGDVANVQMLSVSI